MGISDLRAAPGPLGFSRALKLTTSATATLVAIAIVATAADWYLRRYAPPLREAPNIRFDPLLGWDSVPPIVPLTVSSAPHTVYFIGDSFTQDRRWPSVAQQTAATDGLAVDGYVLGVSGFGTTQEWLKIERDFAQHAPDLVVLQFFAWNDLRDDWPYPAIAYSPTAFRRPYLVPAGSGYTLQPVAARTGLRDAIERTHLWRHIGFRALLRTDDLIARAAINRMASWRLALPVHYTERATWEPFYLSASARDRYVHEAFGATIEAFKRLAQFLARNHARLLVVGLDNPFTVDDDVADAWVRSGIGFDVDLPLRRVGEMLRDAQIPFVDAAPALRAAKQRHHRKIYNPPAGDLSGHLEPVGEDVFGAVAGRAMAELFKRAEAVRQRETATSIVSAR